MNTIEETKHTPCNQPFDALLAEIFKKPEKKPERRQENRDKPDNNHHFTAKSLALLLIMVVVVAGLTAYVVGSIKCRHVIAEHSWLTDGAR
jgi:Ca2+/H+ antiporter